MTDLPKEELDARLSAITRGPWSEGFTKARQKLAPVGGTALFSRAGRTIALDQLKLSPSNKRKSAELSKVLRVHYTEGSSATRQNAASLEPTCAFWSPSRKVAAVRFLPSITIVGSARTVLKNSRMVCR
jgi:hypothetical protein